MTQLLFVCTGNICRSPMAEAITRSILLERGIQAEVASAGFLKAGIPSTDHAIAVMAQRDLDLVAHRSRQVTAALEDPPTIVITMTRKHLRDLVEMTPSLMSRAFTLKEAVRRSSALGPRLPSQDLNSYLDSMAAGRRAIQLMGASTDDDVADPIGQGRRDYERTRDEIDELVRRLIGNLWPRKTNALPR